VLNRIPNQNDLGTLSFDSSEYREWGNGSIMSTEASPKGRLRFLLTKEQGKIFIHYSLT